MVFDKGQVKYWWQEWKTHMTFILPLNMQFFKKAIIFVFLPVIKIVSWIKATSQSSNIVRMHSLGKSYENRDLYILQVSLIKCNNRYGGFSEEFKHRPSNG